MLLRAYRESDAAALCALFFDTVHTVCAKDYTEQQCDAWAPREFDCAALCGRRLFRLWAFRRRRGCPWPSFFSRGWCG